MKTAVIQETLYERVPIDVGRPILDKRSLKMTLINDEIARNAMYIDFEGNAECLPTFLGVLYWDAVTYKPEFKQYVHEAAFHSASENTDRCINKSIEDSLESLVDIAERENRLLFAWSTREKLAIERFLSNEELKERVLARLFDCKKIAKKWKNKFHSHVTFERIWGGGRHRLSEYMSLVGYEVPSSAGPGNTGSRLRYVRNQLLNRDGNYFDLTPVAKRKWKGVIAHNYHDCRGMRHVIKTAIDALKIFQYKKRRNEVT